MKYLLAVMIFLVFGCTKSGDTGPIVSGEQVSGKLSYIVTSYGNKKALLNVYNYDAQGRVIQWKQWEEDTVGSVVQKSSEYMVMFFYNGNDDKPVRDSMSFNGSESFKTVYSYNASNNVAVQEVFRPMDNYQNVYVRYLFYYSNGWIASHMFIRSGSGGMLVPSQYDTCYLNTSGALVNTTEFRPATSVRNGSTSYEYDNKSNPMKNMNIVKHLIMIGGDRFILQYRAPGNVTKYTRVDLSTSTSTCNYTKYSSNGYPLAAVTTNPQFGQPGASVIANVQFYYY